METKSKIFKVIIELLLVIVIAVMIFSAISIQNKVKNEVVEAGNEQQSEVINDTSYISNICKAMIYKDNLIYYKYDLELFKKIFSGEVTSNIEFDDIGKQLAFYIQTGYDEDIALDEMKNYYKELEPLADIPKDKSSNYYQRIITDEKIVITENGYIFVANRGNLPYEKKKICAIKVKDNRIVSMEVY